MANLLDATQRHNAIALLRVVKRRNGTRHEMEAIIASAKVESNIYNLTYGDGTSVGILQLISLNGTLAQRMDIEYCANWWMDNAIRLRPHRRRVGDTAQLVQRSAFPLRYREWETFSAAVVRELVDVAGPPSDRAPSPPVAGPPSPPSTGDDGVRYSPVIRSLARAAGKTGHDARTIARNIRRITH